MLSIKHNNLKVIAVIPAHNEEKHIAQVVRETKKYVDNVIVVDDASTDETGKIAKMAGAIVLRHVVNLGLGGGLNTGSQAAIMLGARVIITLDSDGQHNPKEIPKLVNKLIKNDLDIVIGQRAFNEKMPVIKKAGNNLIFFVQNKLFKINLIDTQSGFRAFKSECYNKIKWESRGYPVASEIVSNVGKKNLKWAEVPIETIYNDEYKGTTPLDGLKIIIQMIGWKFKK